MSYDYYLEQDYPTPEVFKGLYQDNSALIIATGPSTSKLLKHKNNIKNIFDVVIGVNFSILDFDDCLDFYLSTENKPYSLMDEFKENKYRVDVPRIVSYITIDRWPQDLKLFKVYRNTFNRKPGIRRYKTENGDGLFKGYDTFNKAPGSVTLQAMHFATILGCNRIYIIGAELCYETDIMHYYKEYEQNNYPHISHPLSGRNEDQLVEVKIEVTNRQKICKTRNTYKWSAHYINRFIDEECIPNNVEIFDFSNGLLTSATQLDLDSFMSNATMQENINGIK